jgi:hypothetical protein
MRTRVLPREEWDRVQDHTPVFPGLPPEDMSIIVVENDEGSIVASTMILRATHMEGTWVDPQHRNAGVSRGLLRLANAVAQTFGASWLYTGAADDHTRDTLDRMGGTKLAMDTYVLGLGGKACRPQ